MFFISATPGAHNNAAARESTMAKPVSPKEQHTPRGANTPDYNASRADRKDAVSNGG